MGGAVDPKLKGTRGIKLGEHFNSRFDLACSNKIYEVDREAGGTNTGLLLRLSFVIRLAQAGFSGCKGRGISPRLVCT